MARKNSHLAELGLGLLAVSVVLYSYLFTGKSLESFNLKTYDLFVSKLSPMLKQTPSKTQDIQLVGIDDEALSAMGRWPWPRSYIGQLIDEIAVGGAKVIGLNMFLSEPDFGIAKNELDQLLVTYKDILESQKREFRRKKVSLAPFQDFQFLMEESKFNLDEDALLAGSIREAGTLVLPMFFTPGEPLGNNLEPLPAFFQNEAIPLKSLEGTFPNAPPTVAAHLPLERFSESTIGIGHSNLSPDSDGGIRKIAPLVQYGQNFFPSFGVQIVREFLNLSRDTFRWDPQGYWMGKAQIPFDDKGLNYIQFSGPAGTFSYNSALNVLGGLEENFFEGKIVLVGLTATGLGDTYVVPGGDRMAGLEIWANHIENILNQRFIYRPTWAQYAEWGSLGLAALVVLLILPFARAKVSVPISILCFLIIFGGSLFLIVEKAMWVSPAYGLAVLAMGFVLVVAKRWIFTEKGKEMVEAEGMETNKMLGLSFQGQGMLDLAFEKFSKCPLDKQLMDLLYNLGLDMERKRMYTKAAAVYEHIGKVEPKYKDIQAKIELLKKAGEGAVFGGVGKKGTDSTVMVDGLGQNTTLGRYEVIKELGRGAMGIVYLGKDPKINRQVAIKTLQFEDDMTDEQLKSVKERFFREAESAGNLTHPNIIRIFDAGEDQEVAYIAMELLDGHDLKQYCAKGKTLPVERVLEMGIKIADALDFAHSQGVVHRDIKPANLMLLKDQTLRITDFGIARIQATSKTATGAVLGTPAYMSPEQVNGAKVDGRSDIFSLGVTLFELFTGEKPFHADSIAALLYRIANVEHPDPREFNPDIPESVVNILAKALAKEAPQRYQSASELGKDLNAALIEIQQGGGQTKPPLPKQKPAAASPAEAPDIPKKEMPPPPKPVTIEGVPETPAPSNLPPLEKDKKTISEPKGVKEDFYSELQDAFDIPGDVSAHPPKEKKQPNVQEQTEEITHVLEEKENAKTLNIPPEKNDDANSDKTVVLSPDEKKWEDLEKTLVLPPDENFDTGIGAPPKKDKDVSVLPEIEHNFHPDTGDTSKPKKPKDSQ